MKVSANGLSIEVDDQGPVGGEPLLLVMGLGMQLVGWPDELVQMLVERGYRVVRFDNRDIGLSQGFDHLGVPNLVVAAMRYAMGLPVPAPYDVADMAADTVGVLDALGIERAHVCGASMGGMIAQHLAATFPQRLRSLTLMMTSAGARHLPQPSLRVRHALMSRPQGTQAEQLVAHLQRVLGIIGSPAFAPDPARQQQRLQAMVARSWHPAGTARQLVAVLADGDRTPLLSRIEAPTHVIHGEHDPLIPSAAGKHLATHIRAATLDLVPGMGHDLPLQLLQRLAEGIVRNAERAR